MLKSASALILSSLFWIQTAWAEQVNCQPHPTWTGDKGVVSLSGALAANELPNGTVLYTLDYKSQNGSSVDCSTPGPVWGNGNIDFRSEIRLSGTPTLVNGITGPQGAPVYQTNITGIGVFYLAGPVNASQTLPTIGDTSPTVLPIPSGVPWADTTVLKSKFVLKVGLIKTGPISHGNVNGSSLPSVQVRILQPTKYPQHSFSGLPIDTSLIQFGGQLQVVKPTCTIKNKSSVVQLGSHDVSTFTGINSVLPWVDASIELIGCQGFLGYGGNATITGPGTLPSVGPGWNSYNYVAVEVTSASGVISQSNGIIDIAPSSTSATGVGIQLGYERFLGTGLINILSLNTITDSYTHPGVNATDYKIPLRARYIQTENNVSAGRADGAIVYNLTYY